MHSLVDLINNVNTITSGSNALATTQQSTSGSENPMPAWMGFLHRKVSDAQAPDNVKLFIVRALVRTRNVFRPFAAHWYAPLIAFLVNGPLNRAQRTSPASQPAMDYFTLELCVTMLSWHSVAVPSASLRGQVSALFDSLMRRCYHDNRAVLKNNLELLKTVAELWRALIRVSVHTIYEMLNAAADSTPLSSHQSPNTTALNSGGGDDVKRVVVGIQLFGVVLANAIRDYDYPANVRPLDLYTALMRCMRNERSTIVHASSAEVVGMLLKHLDDSANGEKNTLDARYISFIKYLN